jgi:hypothetical protein
MKKDTTTITFEFTKDQKKQISKYIADPLVSAPPGSYAISNEVARVPLRLEIQEIKLLAHFLSKLKRFDDNRDSTGKIEITTSLSDMIKACNSTSVNSSYYKKLAKGLIQKLVVEIRNVVSSVIWEVDFNSPDEVRVRFSEAFIPEINGLADHFTVLTLAYTYQFKSKYSFLLYSYLKSWQSTGATQFKTTEELRDLFGLDPKEYVRPDGKFNRPAFEQKTIQRAVQEINANSDIAVAWKKVYQGQDKRSRVKLVRAYMFEMMPNKDNIMPPKEAPVKTTAPKKAKKEPPKESPLLDPVPGQASFDL